MGLNTHYLLKYAYVHIYYKLKQSLNNSTHPKDRNIVKAHLPTIQPSAPAVSSYLPI